MKVALTGFYLFVLICSLSFFHSIHYRNGKRVMLMLQYLLNLSSTVDEDHCGYHSQNHSQFLKISGCSFCHMVCI